MALFLKKLVFLAAKKLFWKLESYGFSIFKKLTPLCFYNVSDIEYQFVGAKSCVELQGQIKIKL